MDPTKENTTPNENKPSDAESLPDKSSTDAGQEQCIERPTQPSSSKDSRSVEVSYPKLTNELFKENLSTRLFDSFLLNSFLWFLPFGMAELAIATRGFKVLSRSIAPISIPPGLQSPLFTIVVTIAIFAVNFSFLEYQFSTYRPLIRRISTKQIFAATLTLLIAILPLVSLGFTTDWAPTIALLAAPIVTYCSILLSRITYHEIRPQRLLDAYASDKKLRNFYSNFKYSILSVPEEPMEEDDYGTSPSPSHEFAWRPIPPLPVGDPFSFLSSLCASSIQGSDLHTFEIGLNRTLTSAHIISEIMATEKASDSYKSSEIIEGYVVSCIRRIAIITREGEKSDLFSTKFMNICAQFLRRIPVIEHRKSFEFSYKILQIMSEHADNLLKKSSDSSSLVPLILARQLATRLVNGIDWEKPRNEDMDRFIMGQSLAGFPRMMQHLAETAIERKDSNFLYRCLEAIGWLGCSAIKKNMHPLTEQCLASLVQLARIARAKKLECFWTRCAITPPEHAMERVGWILSWTTKLDEKKRNSWVRTIQEAYSRYHGKECELSYAPDSETPDKLRPKLIITEKPFIISFLADGGSRDLDYSDETMLKEFQLY